MGEDDLTKSVVDVVNEQLKAVGSRHKLYNFRKIYLGTYFLFHLLVQEVDYAVFSDISSASETKWLLYLVEKFEEFAPLKECLERWKKEKQAETEK